MESDFNNSQYIKAGILFEKALQNLSGKVLENAIINIRNRFLEEDKEEEKLTLEHKEDEIIF